MRLFRIAGALGCGLAVILGAFAAHALKGQLPPASISTFTTGVTYQFYHCLGLLVVSAIGNLYLETRLLKLAASFFLVGILLFSGSLYGLSLLGWKFLGPVTPFGGLSFILGWGLMAVHFIRHETMQR